MTKINPVDNLISQSKKYPIEIVNRIIKDSRLKDVDIKVTPVFQCVYNKGTKFNEYGFKLACLVPTNGLDKNMIDSIMDYIVSYISFKIHKKNRTLEI